MLPGSYSPVPFFVGRDGCVTHVLERKGANAGAFGRLGEMSATLGRAFFADFMLFEKSFGHMVARVKASNQVRYYQKC